MKITEYSKNKILESMRHWEVPKDFSDSMFNYLVYGFGPGGCFTAVLANDFYSAIQRSHPVNTVQSFKALTGWIHSSMPREAWGNYDAVNNWCYMDSTKRRAILERDQLIYTEQDEIVMALKGRTTNEPILWEQ